ncbi:Planctomycete cytochrome C [Symmachiella dynata]|uniref:PSD1 and planctomycete cytochrome C domain-containing protein n=1 Tax=Symmachiella dynata TaxID=2527995 RepID=UPI00118D20A4|nr:PSD1 and planctomycete cytochrome C domain-containing protein [Symmachiella dynata]QDT49031.1 Planctomycete cytochrome C [Symmachiella dynata]
MLVTLRLLIVITFFILFQRPLCAADGLLEGSQWKRDGFAVARYEISGTGSRNNPLRRKLRAPFASDELFVRFRIQYDADSIDTPEEGNGEFFVLWLDSAEGSDTTTHSGGVPNLGLHVSQGENRFMVRYSSGGEKFGPALQGNREFLIVGRLWKSVSGYDEPFDRFDLWVDPNGDEEFKPSASTNSQKSITAVNWIGFSTGAKTEAGDRIEVWDVDLAATWESILKLPPKKDSVLAKPAVVQRTVNFETHVLPLLKSRCFECHSGDEPESGVRLDLVDEVLNQTVVRNAAKSRLFEVVEQGEMPPEDEPLDADEKAILKAWIDEGLDWNEKLLPTPPPVTDHWAFQKIRRPNVPDVKNRQWVRTPVDSFIARRHEELGLTPAPEADAQTLERRISLDLTGLPPSDNKQTMDDYLASPAYGARWGRHWLDIVRWAESNGHQHNRNRPHAWRYRDWVVDAFNDDKPFDRFLLEQIAGDELEPASDESVIATGFLAAARYSGNELDKSIQRNDILVDVANTTAQVFLGLTMECAQCHSHKFDPVSIRDYYRFQAFFAQGQPENVIIAEDETVRSLIDEYWQIFDSVHDRIVNVRRKQGHPEPIYVTPTSVINGMRKSEKTRFQELRKTLSEFPQTWGFYAPSASERPALVAPLNMRWPLPRIDGDSPLMETAILLRGDVQSRGPVVQPGWPALFGPMPDRSEKPRSQLAAWMTDPANPLTARVWVNRIWQWHFGRGLVETSADFGTQGSKPTHPELLDFLASELIDSGWSTKHIHRLIVDSATYRQSSQFQPHNSETDPDNNMLWRWLPRRLEAEAIRDSILAVSGCLDAETGGPSDIGQSKRRSLYRHQKRGALPVQQILFDGADGITVCSHRRVSTSALQPLWLLNSHFVQENATAFAQRAKSVENAFHLALGRKPTAEELTDLEALAEQADLHSACLAILNCSEFLYIP